MVMVSQEDLRFAVPEPELTAQQIIQRAKDLQPWVRREAEASAERGTYSPELHDAFLDAGFYRILQPRRFGGYEFDVTTFFKVIIEIAQGDPGSGWCLCLGAGHAMQAAAHFPVDVQAELFGAKGYFIAPFSAAPRGLATRVEGGYRVSGTWAYSSGVPYSTHFMGTALRTGAAGKKEKFLVVIPRHEITILDDWGGGRTMGLQSSGSNSVLVEDVFVPERFTSTGGMLAGSGATAHAEDDGVAQGARIHNNPIYMGNILPFAAGELACSQIGAARGALAEFENIVRTKKRVFEPQILMYLHPDTHKTYGQALRLVDCAETLVLNAADVYKDLCEEWVNGAVRPDEEEFTRCASQIMKANELAWEAGELLFRSVGTTAARSGELLQRLFLDLEMQRTQWTPTSDRYMKLLGQQHFRVPPDPMAASEPELVERQVTFRPSAV
ncbi:MAG: hypothetical protein M3N95_04760 [Actinomycetota bacterium]|nr:hypothetical protein [Actinomycetota bacterium]